MHHQTETVPDARRLVLADSASTRKAALDELLPYQREDFTGIFKAMSGLSVTVRLLDPPLHEFLPSPEEMESGGAAEEIAGYTVRRRETSRPDSCLFTPHLEPPARLNSSSVFHRFTITCLKKKK